MVKIVNQIEVNPNIHHRKPVIAGIKVPVHIILGLLSNGIIFEEII